MAEAQGFLLDAKGVERLKKLLTAWETGRLNQTQPQMPVSAGEPVVIYLGQTTEDIDALTGDTPGSGSVELYSIDDGGDLADMDLEDTAYNLFAADIPDDSTVAMVREPISGNLVIVATSDNLFPLTVETTNNGTGDSTVTTPGVGTLLVDQASGLKWNGTSLQAQPASDTHAGVVTTGTQTFAGDKTFEGVVTALQFVDTPRVQIDAGSGDVPGSLYYGVYGPTTNRRLTLVCSEAGSVAQTVAIGDIHTDGDSYSAYGLTLEGPLAGPYPAFALRTQSAGTLLVGQSGTFFDGSVVTGGIITSVATVSSFDGGSF